MNDRDRLDHLLAEVVSAPFEQAPAPEALELLNRAFEDDVEFARKGAATLLTMRALDALPSGEPAPHFVPPPVRRRSWTGLVPAAALLIGILLGRFGAPGAQESTPPPTPEPIRVEIVRPPAERELRESTFAYRPHRYENGLLAGKALRIETGPR